MVSIVRLANVRRSLRKSMPTIFVRAIRGAQKTNLARVSQLVGVFANDLWRFARHSAALRANTRNKLRAKIIRQAHIVEKGLSLSDPSITLSKFRFRPLLTDLTDYQAKYGEDEVVGIATSALNAYAEFAKNNPSLSIDHEDLRNGLDLIGCGLSRSAIDTHNPPTHQVTRDEVLTAARYDLDMFFKTRHSIRRFSRDTEVELEKINRAVEMAINTPSACNRQPWRVYLVRDDKMKRRVLRLQGGNRGFGSEASLVLVVTADLNAALQVGERH